MATDPLKAADSDSQASPIHVNHRAQSSDTAPPLYFPPSQGGTKGGWQRIADGHVKSHPVRRALLAGYFVCLMTSTHIPDPMMPVGLSGGTDLWVHGAAYAGLAAISLWAFAGLRGLKPTWEMLFLAVLACIAAADELTQAWVNRTPAWGDWLADAAGASVACFTWRAIRSFSRGRRTPGPEFE